MQAVLETERLVLRRFTGEDVDNLVELDSDPEVMRFITGGRPSSREEIEKLIMPAFLGYDERFGGLGFWAAVERSTGQFVGWFHLRPAEGATDEVELGYRLRRSVWGKGYATEGSRALIEKVFAEYGARRALRVDDGRERRLSAGDGEGRTEVRADLSPAMAGSHRGRGGGRRRIRAPQIAVGAEGALRLYPRARGSILAVRAFTDAHWRGGVFAVDVAHVRVDILKRNPGGDVWRHVDTVEKLIDPTADWLGSAMAARVTISSSATTRS